MSIAHRLVLVRKFMTLDTVANEFTVRVVPVLLGIRE